MKIIHLSTDYPDSIAPDKTHAIRNLIEATRRDFDHIVYSLNRRSISPLLGLKASLSGWTAHAEIQAVAQDSDGPVWRYDAPDNGLFLRGSLQNLGDAIADDIIRSGMKPDLIVGHKLSMEGIIAAQISRRLNVPYALSLQGNSDRNIVGIRRDLRGLYARIFHGAAVVFPFAPWALDYCERVLGKRAGPNLPLPCITSQQTILAPLPSNGRLMTAFHLRHQKIKNLPRMLDAAARLAKDGGGIGFDIYGGGDAADCRAVSHAAGMRAGIDVKLAGAVAHDQMQRVMNGYAGFVMISRKESFGLVFIEALLAGCPVAYPRGAAIDGYFDGAPFALAVDANNTRDIANAMDKLRREELAMKAALLQWQQSGAAARFQKTAIAEQFRGGLNLAINKEPDGNAR